MAPARGAGLQTINLRINQLKLCTDANPQAHPTRSVTTAAIYMIFSVKLTAKNASGRGRRKIRSLGSLLKLPAAAKPPTLSRLSGVTTVPTLMIKNVVLTAESVAGLGTLQTQISGQARLPLVDAKTGRSDLCTIDKKLISHLLASMKFWNLNLSLHKTSGRHTNLFMYLLISQFQLKIKQ